MIETLDDRIAECTEPIEWFISDDGETVLVVALNGWVQGKLDHTCQIIGAAFPGSLDIAHKGFADEIAMAVQASGQPGTFLLNHAVMIAEWFEKLLPKGGME